MGRQRRRSKKAQLWNQYPHQCCYCGIILTFSQATVDHYHARSQGGENSIDNLRLACLKCNREKRDTHGREYRVQLESFVD